METSRKNLCSRMYRSRLSKDGRKEQAGPACCRLISPRRGHLGGLHRLQRHHLPLPLRRREGVGVFKRQRSRCCTHSSLHCV